MKVIFTLLVPLIFRVLILYVEVFKMNKAETAIHECQSKDKVDYSLCLIYRTCRSEIINTLKLLAGETS